MKKIDVLVWGIKHIASNYKMGADVDYEEEGQVGVYVTDEHPDCSPAPINDVQMLCDDLDIPRGQVETSEYGIDVWVDYAWTHTKADCEGYCPTDEAGRLLEEYVPNPVKQMWKKYGVEIGSPIPERIRTESSAVSMAEPATPTGDVYVDLPF